MQENVAAIYKSCLECDSHLVIDDPDPRSSSFNDDKAVVCTEAKNNSKKIFSRYKADRSKFRAITVSCRPNNLKKESTIPSWCPKRG